MKKVIKNSMHPTVKLLLDLGPVIAFVVGYWLGGLMTATVVIMAATALSFVIHFLHDKKIAMAPLISGVLIGVFGGLTLVLNDETFIKMKPTIVNLIFAGVLLGGVAFGKSLLRYLLEVAFKLTEEGWRGLSLRWGVFFIGLAVLNEIIWRHFSTDFWVNFKLFGMFSLNILFWVVNMPFIQKHMIKEEPSEKTD